MHVLVMALTTNYSIDVTCRKIFELTANLRRDIETLVRFAGKIHLSIDDNEIEENWHLLGPRAADMIRCSSCSSYDLCCSTIAPDSSSTTPIQ